MTRPLRKLRELDTRWSRRDGRRRVLIDGHTPVNFTMIAPVYARLREDPRLEFYFTASHERARLREVYAHADGVRLIGASRARWVKFDAYVASDFVWANLPRGACRIQVFHGVAGKYGFDAPTSSMRDWDRLFFANERRLRNFIASGAIDPDSPAIRLIGLPKSDCLVDGTFRRDDVLSGLRLDPALPTVLYAPTWSPASSLNAIGLELVQRLLDLPINVVVKLHDRSRDPRPFYSGGVDWVAALEPVLRGRRGALAPGADVSPYLVAADAMVTDHSSAGFEYLLLDRPLIRIHRPELLTLANVHPDYVALLASAATSVNSVEETVAAVESGLSSPDAGSAERRAVASDLFYKPGGATARSVAALYDAMELEPAAVAAAVREMRCQPSA
jgi:hypothetical protein